MSLVNEARLIGRLGRDPESKGDGSVVTFSIATSEKYKDKSGQWVESTEWHNIVCFNKQAEVVMQYLSKGDEVTVSGKIQTKKYTGRDGAEKKSTQIVMREMRMHSNNNAAKEKRDDPPTRPVSDDAPF